MHARQKVEFGDFQTPIELARSSVEIVKTLGIYPASVIEPSCGSGNFLVAAAEQFERATMMGLEINEGYLDVARARLARELASGSASLLHGNFFTTDWSKQLSALSPPLLVIGNPPWVTSATLGSFGSGNLPSKSNFQNMSGFDALTGKSNFDISEWMLLRYLEWVSEKTGALAILCKMAVARKVLGHAWKRRMPIKQARAYKIDAQKYFGAAVEACFLIIEVDGTAQGMRCNVYESFESQAPFHRFGYVDGAIVSDIETYNRLKHLRGQDGLHTWRSGLKHDCASIMELERDVDGWLNGLGETVHLEETYLFPLIKSSDIAGVRRRPKQKYVIVPQQTIGESTEPILRRAPLTWQYLQQHKASFAKRTSAIYRGKPQFSVFGIGKYSFAPWKVAISGLYKKLAFRLYGPAEGKPIVFDDTVYFLPFDGRKEAEQMLSMLNSQVAQEFLSSLIFWDHKRPITADILKKLNLSEIARFLGQHCPVPALSAARQNRQQPRLAFED
jgi:methylase of polypeptide subunit release factors